MSQYKIGTATFTNGSATVTGSGTAWLANVAIGDYIVRGGENVSYIVGGVASDTSLTLTAPYGGVTGSGVSYVAHRDFHPKGAPKFANGDVEFAAIQNEWNRRDPASFGTAASADLTTSATDTTAGRVLKVGDAGVLSRTNPIISDLKSLVPAGLYSVVGSTLNLPPGVFNGSAFVTKWSTGGATESQAVIVFDMSGGAAWVTRFDGYDTKTWSEWSKQYGQNNLLGTVSQSGGVPTGAVIERGSNANGEYVKFADGTLICTHRITDASLDITTAHFGGVRSAGLSWTYPAAFAVADAVGATSSNVNSFGVGLGNPTTSACTYFHTAVTSQGVATRQVELIAIGRWF